MLNLPIKILDRIVVGAGGVADVTFTLGNLIAEWDAREGITSRHLVVIVNAASPDAVAQRDVHLQFNGDTGDNYNYQELTGVDADDAAASLTGVAQLVPFPIPGTDYANAFGGGLILIPHAFGTVDHTAVLALGGAAEDEVKAMAGRWANIAAITSVTLAPDTGDFAEASEFLLGVIDERYLVEEIEDADASFLPAWHNIPQGEGDLVVIGYPRSERANTVDDIRHSINDDATDANYVRTYLEGVGAAPGANAAITRMIGSCAGDTAAANAFGAFVAVYSQYTKQNQPHYLVISGLHASAAFARVRVTSGRRDNVEVISGIRLIPDIGSFMAGSLFSLYRVPKRLIGRVIVPAGGQATITFDNIPQYYEALILHVYARTDRGVVLDQVALTINGDAVAANYNRQVLEGGLLGVTASRSVIEAWLSVAAAGGATVFGGGTLFLLGYSRTDGHKHGIVISGPDADNVTIMSTRWENNAAITSIVLTPRWGPNFLAGSVFELEGVLRKEGLPADAGMRIGIP